MKTIKVLECNCGEDVYEDDKIKDGHPDFVYCINCQKAWPAYKLREQEVAEITRE